MPLTTLPSKRNTFGEISRKHSSAVTIIRVSSFLNSPADTEAPTCLPIDKPATQADNPVSYPVAPVLEYIQETWQDLLVSNSKLLSVIPEEKVEQVAESLPRLYISKKENKNTVLEALQSVLSAEDLQKIEIVFFPSPETIWINSLPACFTFPIPILYPADALRKCTDGTAILSRKAYSGTAF